MKRWFAMAAAFLILGLILFGIGFSGSSFDDSALEAAIEDRTAATAEWVTYMGEVNDLEEELDDVSLKLETEEWAMGSNTAKAQQLRQEKARIQAALDLAKFYQEDASAAMDHYSAIVEELEAEKESAGGDVNGATVFGVLSIVAALGFSCVGLYSLTKTKEAE